jgi:hypothetical protein
MDVRTAVLTVSVFLVGWVASGFIIMGPEILRQLKARRRMEEWRRVTSEGARHHKDGQPSSDRHQ